jgi:hypothetical protein
MELQPPARRRWLHVVLAAALVISAISIAAVLDHRHKMAVRRSLAGAGWYCTHYGQRCEEAQRSTSVEDRWNTREAIYMGSIAMLGGVIVVTGAARLIAGGRTRASKRSPAS